MLHSATVLGQQAQREQYPTKSKKVFYKRYVRSCPSVIHSIIGKIIIFQPINKHFTCSIITENGTKGHTIIWQHEKMTHKERTYTSTLTQGTFPPKGGFFFDTRTLSPHISGNWVNRRCLIRVLICSSKSEWICISSFTTS